MTSKKPAKRPGQPSDSQSPRPGDEKPAQRAIPRPRGTRTDNQAQDPQDDLPVALRPEGLTPLEWRFAQEYPVDLNATRAYQRANPDAAASTAATEGSKLLRNPQVSREIKRLLDERAAITGITADRVLIRLWEMATADARKLTEFRIGSCRHCWGMYHQYHYTEAEFSAAQDKHIREQTSKVRKDKEYEPTPFAEKGGPGFDPNRPPNSECPECWGRGKGMPIIHDTRHLGPGEAMIYAGIKVSAEGNVEIKTHSPFEALQLIGRHLGMWNDKIKVGDTENPLFALIQQIQASHSTVPIVAQDPELKRAGEVQDVEAKPPKAPGAGPVKAKVGGWRAAK